MSDCFGNVCGIDSKVNTTDKLSRRDAIKLATLLGVSSFVNPPKSSASSSSDENKSKIKIVIVGGGFAGTSIAHRLVSSFTNPVVTIIEPNEKSVSYQSGQTFVASGIWNSDDISYDTQDYLPNSSKWIKDRVVSFFPDNNYVSIFSGEKISYDYLVIASGVVLDYSKIKGLEEVGAIYSTGNNSKANKYLKNIGVNSIYFADGAKETCSSIENFVDKNKNGSRLRAIFSEPNTPIKGSGASWSLMCLMDAKLREASANARLNAGLHLYLDSSSMIEVPDYNITIVNQFKQKDIRCSYSHNLTEIDYKNKIAIFDRHWIDKGVWDDNRKTYPEVVRHQKIKVPYNFIHVVPPMRSSDVLINSELCSADGFVSVDKHTLQHTIYDNIFSLGDTANVPMGKTVSSAKEQCVVVVQNILSLSKGLDMSATYDGYTSYFVATSFGASLLAEFDWTKKSTPSFPLNPQEHRWIWWILQNHLMKPVTMHGIIPDRV
jgi:sulfide:quinone oxidoreductase